MSDPARPEVFYGVDVFATAAAAVGCALVAVTAWTWASALVSAPIAAVAAVVAGLFCVRRYRITVAPSGVELAYLRAWVLRVRRQRFLIDARIDFYQSWDAPCPQGLCIVPARRRPGEQESSCFGPSWSQARLTQLHGAVAAAIDAARRLVPPAPPLLRNALLMPYRDALDIAGARRDWQGRLRRVVSRAPIRIGGTRLPAGSVFELNGEAFLDPARDDALVAVEARSAFTLPNGLDVTPGTRMHFDERGRLRGLRGTRRSEAFVQGRYVVGDAPLAWDERGRLTGFTLARPTRVGRWSIPAGSRFLPPFWGGGPWPCELGASFALPEVRLGAGDRIHVSVRGDRLTAIAPRRDLAIGRSCYRTVDGSIPVRPNGRIDRPRARARGTVSW